MQRQQKSKSRVDLRLCAATIGASAVVAMTAIGLMVAQEHDGAAVAKSKPITMGVTSTQTTPSTAPAVGMAKPTMKGPAPLPSEENAAK
ncbi:hypothetical protein AB4Z42_12185 [Mycobacterium sp. 2YAF39]|uniref:hypothetical protein n=1 Tax=Mycobacterium sp. 2YAF39 TaxID=3233033 RepID=UPI003F9C385D